MKMVRKSYSLPPSLDADLTYLARRIGVTRSALLASLMQEPLAHMRELIEGIPENATPEQIVRARGSSLALIDQRVTELREVMHELLSQ